MIEPGAVADLVVLDRDPFDGPASEIGAARVASSWVAGQVYAGTDRCGRVVDGSSRDSF